MSKMIATVMVVFLCLISGSVFAQTVCGKRAAVLKQLGDIYKETPISMALAANGSVVEVTRSEKGSWTLLLTNPAGVTCLMAAGESWENLRAKTKGDGA